MNETANIPAHIAIIMDGNGRWATQRNRPRTMGHQAGLKALRSVTERCGQLGVEQLTVFAFSSENWNRPDKEVNLLMDLFMRALDKETKTLHKNGVRIRFMGEIQAFSPNLQNKISRAIEKTAANSRMTLNVAVNYGGRWNIVQAAKILAESVLQGKIKPDDIDEKLMGEQVQLLGGDEPDLFIRTGGELRISNFLLWQTAYSEMHFSPVLWPDFGAAEIDEAISDFQKRERRFGLTSVQIREKSA